MPATPSGLVLALVDEEPKRPASLRDDAVTLMTYHGAKGLEWPCVVMTGLGKDVKLRLFEPVASAQGAIDWRNPLADRWIRFWPWPYGGLSTNVGLDGTALASPLGQVDAIRARDEAARLLYVGATRARDHLILAPPASGALKWLSVLSAGGADHVVLPSAQGEPLRAGTGAFPVNVKVLTAEDETVASPPTAPFVRVTRVFSDRAPLHRRPSEAIGARAYHVVERITLGPRLPLVGSPDMRALGEAVHAIVAADRAGAAEALRLVQAQNTLDRWGVHQISAKDVLDASDRLHAAIGGRWPDATTYRETPISARLGDQLVNGRIDMLVEHAGGFAVVDHKSFPGSRDTWEGRAAGYGPQLGLYAEALDRARPGVPCELFVHMPIVGALLRVAPIEEKA